MISNLQSLIIVQDLYALLNLRC